MKRTALGVFVGYAAWTALWLGGNALLFSEARDAIQAGETYTQAGPLAGILGLSVACSLIAGALAARLALSRARGALLTLAALLLLTGIAVQVGVWASLPVWYHVAFLALLLPITIAGGRLLGGNAPRAA